MILHNAWLILYTTENDLHYELHDLCIQRSYTFLHSSLNHSFGYMSKTQRKGARNVITWVSWLRIGKCGWWVLNRLRKGHWMLDLSTRDMTPGPKILPLPIVSIHWKPPRRGQHLYKGQNSWIILSLKCPLLEFPLYVRISVVSQLLK